MSVNILVGRDEPNVADLFWQWFRRETTNSLLSIE